MLGEHPIQEGAREFKVGTGNVETVPTIILELGPARGIFPRLFSANGELQSPEGERLRQVRPRILTDEPVTLIHGQDLTSFSVHSTLGVIEIKNEQGETRYGVTGNTLLRNCPHGDCSIPGGHTEQPLSHGDRLQSNCAAANTEEAFIRAGQENRAGRFMMLPTTDEVLIMGEGPAPTQINLTDENGESHVAFNRLSAARSVVISEKWAKDNDLEDGITILANVADSAIIKESYRYEDENFISITCLTRQNLGNRSEKEKILRNSKYAVFASKGVPPEEYQKELGKLEDVRAELITSATLPNFAHKVHLPEPGSSQAKDLAIDMGISDEAFSSKHALTKEGKKIADRLEEVDLETEERQALRAKFSAIKGNLITPAKILDALYPGAFPDPEDPESRGLMFSEYEAVNGIVDDPLTPERCVMFGDFKCNIDYRGFIEKAVAEQLKGVGKGKLTWVKDHALDSADGKNELPSNRREQNEGISPNDTSRGVSGGKFIFDSRMNVSF